MTVYVFHCEDEKIGTFQIEASGPQEALMVLNAEPIMQAESVYAYWPKDQSRYVYLLNRTTEANMATMVVYEFHPAEREAVHAKEATRLYEAALKIVPLARRARRRSETMAEFVWAVEKYGAVRAAMAHADQPAIESHRPMYQREEKPLARPLTDAEHHVMYVMCGQGKEPGSFTTHLIEAAARADHRNAALLRNSFPNIVDAVLDYQYGNLNERFEYQNRNQP